ncbi:NUDIX hydrolase [uncultured Sphingomonas sp.]|uniref:NUDIX hydrolase n=1 Tax=uncultured Sphingomonas sp. TaxID=158754 RepID=UPI0035CC836E
MSDPVETPWHGRFLEIRTQGTWEYAARRGDLHAAVILAIHEGAVILVEQYRTPLGCRTIELPAGLVGDQPVEDGHEPETVEAAAARELEEETGYRPSRIEPLGVFASSPGMTSETFTLVRATGLTRVGDGGGEEGEGITVHTIPLAAVAGFVAAKRAEGYAVDVKMLLVLAGGFLA